MSDERRRGFDKVFELDRTAMYPGHADRVLLVWNKFQIAPAESYRQAHFPGETADICVCEDPNAQKNLLGERAIIYHFR